MRILAIDPGTIQSGHVLYDPGKSVTGGTDFNADIFGVIEAASANIIAIEMIASYGMPVGREVFDTCVWIGRFMEFCHQRRQPTPVLVYRKEVKMEMCHSMKATDANIWQSLCDRFGSPGTAKAPGFLYGIKSHARAALAVAVYVEMMIRASKGGVR